MEVLGRSEPLRVAKAYQHMGCAATPKVDHIFETQDRARSASAAYSSLRPKVFAAGCIEVAVEHSLLAALTWSRLFYNAGVWSELGDRASLNIKRPYMLGLRAIHGMLAYEGAPVMYTDLQVLAQAQEIDHVARIGICRIRYLFRFLLHAPEILVRLELEVQGCERSWSKAVQADLQWVHERSDALQVHPSPAEAWHEWLAMLLRDPGKWRPLLSRETRRAGLPE